MLIKKVKKWTFMQRKIVEENILAYACKMQAFDSVKPSVNMQGPKRKDGPVISEN